MLRRLVPAGPRRAERHLHAARAAQVQYRSQAVAAPLIPAHVPPRRRTSTPPRCGALADVRAHVAPPARIACARCVAAAVANVPVRGAAPARRQRVHVAARRACLARVQAVAVRVRARLGRRRRGQAAPDLRRVRPPQPRRARERLQVGGARPDGHVVCQSTPPLPCLSPTSALPIRPTLECGFENCAL
ncbi:hypothetical protein FGB62_17g18 [Gracilaria domingensis]|nr:hypothetical protein FGB62_17g18 [Gracilaria domingensis]